ncbi:hypothetical protein NXC24_PB00375 (plasmid) [Rhizobium sp. NXC24]|nr:hypothetical protein NXC24_PB00375 [Rhizobium sp. NXC24]
MAFKSGDRYARQIIRIEAERPSLISVSAGGCQLIYGSANAILGGARSILQTGAFIIS